MDPTFWAFVALVVFLIGIIYLGVPGKLGTLLDSRAEEIRNELEEARRLREEAQSVLADYQRKRAGAESEAEEIIAQAEVETERMVQETNAALQDMIERRTKAAELKIAQAEAQALAEVRSLATDVAISAAESVLKEKIDGKIEDSLISDSIKAVKMRMN
jgi:F-type H+-transporting ATPase subunit b